jgi:hypothetical protein
MWIFWAVLTVFGFASSLKRMTERATEHYCACRKLRRARNLARHEREERERCAPRRQGILGLLPLPVKNGERECTEHAPPSTTA